MSTKIQLVPDFEPLRKRLPAAAPAPRANMRLIERRTGDGESIFMQYDFAP